MTKNIFSLFVLLAFTGVVCAQSQVPARTHPDTSEDGWKDLFAPDLSNALDPAGVWTVEDDSTFTASEDAALWSEQSYNDYILDLEVKLAPHANSGVVVHASDMEDWIPNSLEIQIGDDYDPDRTEPPTNTQAGSAFGHVAPTKQMIKPAGEWNHFTITALGDEVWVVVNGEFVTEIDMSDYTSAEVNPDNTEIPEWLSNPLATLPTEGHIGFQGQHGGAPIWFRNIKIKELD
ncbi:MAG: 3-keto-disaccharide hydrolase [Rhodothermales bacterium]